MMKVNRREKKKENERRKEKREKRYQIYYSRETFLQVLMKKSSACAAEGLSTTFNELILSTALIPGAPGLHGPPGRQVLQSTWARE